MKLGREWTEASKRAEWRSHKRRREEVWILLEVLIGVRFAPDTTLRYQKSAVNLTEKKKRCGYVE
jgi:hypothetical protein